jgi:hypothetical protein
VGLICLNVPRGHLITDGCEQMNRSHFPRRYPAQPGIEALYEKESTASHRRDKTQGLSRAIVYLYGSPHRQ